MLPHTPTALRALLIALVFAAPEPTLAISRPASPPAPTPGLVFARPSALVEVDGRRVEGVGYQTQGAAASGDAPESPRLSSSGPAFAAVFPYRADGTYGVRSGNVAVTITAIGAQAVPAAVDRGMVSYSEIFPGVDAVHTTHTHRSEEFLTLKNTDAPRTFTYALSYAPGSRIVLLETGGLLISAEHDASALLIGAPYCIDARGKRSNRAACYGLSSVTPTDATLHLTVDVRSLEFPILVDPSWTMTSPMKAGRSGHAAVSLGSGKVLVAGGYAASPTGLVESAACEFYNASATPSAWTTTGPMTTARTAFPATLQADGRVLACGGALRGAYLASAEIYSHSAKRWTPTGSMRVARYGHSATLLTSGPNAGKILVTGGFVASGLYTLATATAELFDPATGAWTSAPPMTTARGSHRAVRLGDGTVLIVSGTTTDSIGRRTSTPTSEIYDPQTGTWNTFRAFPAPTTGREGFAVVLLADGKRVLVAGGSGAASGALTPTALVYTHVPTNPSADAWRLTSPLPEARDRLESVLLTNGRILVVGGRSSTTAYSTSTEVWDPATGSWSTTPGLQTGRNDHRALLLQSGQVLVCGGLAASGAVLASAELR